MAPLVFTNRTITSQHGTCTRVARFKGQGSWNACVYVAARATKLRLSNPRSTLQQGQLEQLVEDGVAAFRATNPGNNASDPSEKLLQECGVQQTRAPFFAVAVGPAASSSTWPEGSLEPVAKAITDHWLKK